MMLNIVFHNLEKLAFTKYNGQTISVPYLYILVRLGKVKQAILKCVLFMYVK